MIWEHYIRTPVEFDWNDSLANHHTTKMYQGWGQNNFLLASALLDRQSIGQCWNNFVLLHILFLYKLWDKVYTYSPDCCKQ